MSEKNAIIDIATLTGAIHLVFCGLQVSDHSMSSQYSLLQNDINILLYKIEINK